MTELIAGVRCKEGDFEGEFITLLVPRCFEAYIPVIEETRFYDLNGISHDRLLSKLSYGMGKTLTDAGSGLKENQAEALKKVNEKEKRLFSDGRTVTDPLTSKMHKIACEHWKDGGASEKQLPKLRAFVEWLGQQSAESTATLRQQAQAALDVEAAEKAKRAKIGLPDLPNFPK